MGKSVGQWWDRAPKADRLKLLNSPEMGGTPTTPSDANLFWTSLSLAVREAIEEAYHEEFGYSEMFSAASSKSMPADEDGWYVVFQRVGGHAWQLSGPFDTENAAKRYSSGMVGQNKEIKYLKSGQSASMFSANDQKPLRPAPVLAGAAQLASPSTWPVSKLTAIVNDIEKKAKGCDKDAATAAKSDDPYDRKEMKKMYEMDAQDMRSIADDVRHGRLAVAARSAWRMDTAARDRLPQSFWKMVEALNLG